METADQQPVGGTPAKAPSVTTVVMTRNRRAEAVECVRRNAPPLILIDNGSTDGTADTVRSLRRPGVDVVALPRNIGAPARNIGVRLAGTPLVAFADDDSWWAPGALDRAAETFAAHPRLGLLAGRLLVGAEGSIDPVAEHMATAPLGTDPALPGPDVLGFMACAAVVRREAFLASGGFDDVVRFPGEEERVALDLAALGWAMAYVEDVVAHHLPSGRRAPDTHRAQLIMRNGILTAVMRRPWRVVLRRVEQAARSGPTGRRALAAAGRRLPSAMRARRRVPPFVERRIEALEAIDDLRLRGSTTK